MENFVIESETQALDMLQRALQGEYDSEIIDLSLQDWPKLNIKIKGDRYNSTLTAPIMKSMVDIQSCINRVYAKEVYGKAANSLSSQEREALEILFTVNQGSSIINVDFSAAFTEIAASMVDKMTGTEIVVAVLGLAMIWGATNSFKTKVAADKETASTRAWRDALVAVSSHHAKMFTESESDREKILTSIVRGAQDADHISINDTQLNSGEIQAVLQRERKSSAPCREDAMYIILSLKIKPDSYRIELLEQESGKVFSADLLKSRPSISDKEKITSAFHQERPIFLNVVARKIEDRMVSAYIIGVENQADGKQISGEDMGA